MAEVTLFLVVIALVVILVRWDHQNGKSWARIAAEGMVLLVVLTAVLIVMVQVNQ